MVVMASSARGASSRSARRTFPVTVRQLPVVRCEICGRTLAHQTGRANEILTAHYSREHPVVTTG
jgi:hypothetical protein